MLLLLRALLIRILLRSLLLLLLLRARWLVAIHILIGHGVKRLVLDRIVLCEYDESSRRHLLSAPHPSSPT